MVIGPCRPAAGPAIVLITRKWPAAAGWKPAAATSASPPYRFVTVTGTTVPPGTATVRPLPATVVVTAPPPPSAISATVHTAPAGTSKRCEMLPAGGSCGDHEVRRQDRLTTGDANGGRFLAAGLRAVTILVTSRPAAPGPGTGFSTKR